MAILIDSTIQHRASVHPENAKIFNHGKGFVIGHQWTNMVLLLNDSLIPLPPIPFYSKRYCQEHNITYQTEHELVIDYIEKLCLEDYIGAHDPHDVVVLADRGYDDKKIAMAIVNSHSAPFSGILKQLCQSLLQRAETALSTDDVMRHNHVFL